MVDTERNAAAIDAFKLLTIRIVIFSPFETTRRDLPGENLRNLAALCSEFLHPNASSLPS
jgi:hypothetical protein